MLLPPTPRLLCPYRSTIVPHPTLVDPQVTPCNNTGTSGARTSSRTSGVESGMPPEVLTKLVAYGKVTCAQIAATGAHTPRGTTLLTFHNLPPYTNVVTRLNRRALSGTC